jgi:HPt (histidine-containing phosphotransfer) domain-containing protein
MGAHRSAAHTLHESPLELPLDELLERLGGEQEMLLTLAQMLVDEAPRALTEMREWLDRGDGGQLERTAHRLVGTLLAFGAEDAVAVARSVELLGRDRKLADARGLFPQLQREVQRVVAALDRVIRTSRT